MSREKMFFTIIGAALAIIGLGGIPIYAIQQDLIRFGLFTAVFITGLVILGYAAK